MNQFKQSEDQTMPSLSENELTILEKIRRINNPEKVSSISEKGSIGYLIENLKVAIDNWESLTDDEIHLYQALKFHNKKSSQGEYELSNAFINSETEEEYKELEPDIYFYLGKAVDPTGERGFISETDVIIFLELEAKSPDVLADKRRFLEELETGKYDF